MLDYNHADTLKSTFPATVFIVWCSVSLWISVDWGPDAGSLALGVTPSFKDGPDFTHEIHKQHINVRDGSDKHSSESHCVDVDQGRARVHTISINPALSFEDTTCRRAANASFFSPRPRIIQMSDAPSQNCKLGHRWTTHNRTTALLSSEEETYPMPNS